MNCIEKKRMGTVKRVIEFLNEMKNNPKISASAAAEKHGIYSLLLVALKKFALHKSEGRYCVKKIKIDKDLALKAIRDSSEEVKRYAKMKRKGLSTRPRLNNKAPDMSKRYFHELITMIRSHKSNFFTPDEEIRNRLRDISYLKLDNSSDQHLYTINEEMFWIGKGLRSNVIPMDVMEVAR